MEMREGVFSLRTNSRFGDLGRIFGGGQSELLTHIARLSVVYEDLRLEIGELKRLADGPLDEYRVMYFLRRALTTLIEFRGGLTQLRGCGEFKSARLSALDAKYIEEADRCLQDEVIADLFKGLRDDLGGHVQVAGVKLALGSLSGVDGEVMWNCSSDDFGLELHFAKDIVSVAILKKLPGGPDVRSELTGALKTLFDAYGHMQGAVNALVHAFLWDAMK